MEVLEVSFTCQGKTWTRRELPGKPVEITFRHSDSVYFPTVSTTWTGKHILSDGERKLTVERSTVTDGGKLGTSLTYTKTVKPVNVGGVLAGMGYHARR